MTAPAQVPTETLPTLIDRATSALAAARTSGEVLEARDMARVAYDAAKSAARMTKAKEAHDSLVAEVHRAQANALAIRARAEMRLAEEYDAAQERGEVQPRGGNRWLDVGDDNIKPATAADLGLRRDEIHEARRFREAEEADPGVVERTVNGMVERGEEPTRAALRREVIEKPKPQPKEMDGRALWLWGRLKDFERDGIVEAGAAHLLQEMTPPMRADVQRLAPVVRAFLQSVEDQT